ncbi:MAG: HlyD family efflux transporter periplasmic adaptor subunit [Nitrococcus mobilis]|nr:HlyD family efflux transporter periplasmic adaptor subunit [Nitrococcus mobilis]
MSDKRPEPYQPRLQDALEDHSAEGITILSSEPSRLTRALILLLFALLLAGAAWSFIGHADVIVQAGGVLGPDAEERRIYSPVDGELVNIYLAEGMPVAKGDILARVEAVNAIQLATQALQAKLKLTDAQQQHELLPDRIRVLEQQLNLLQVQIDQAQRLHDRRVNQAIAKLGEEQRIRLGKARTQLKEAKNERDYARAELEKYERLYRSPGGGGLSRQQVDAKRREYMAKQAAYDLARAELAQFEVDLSKVYQSSQAEVQQTSEKLLSLRTQYAQKKLELATLENEGQLQLRIARATAEGAARVSFDDIDEENLLLVRAPVAGVITRLALTQPGDKVVATQPIASIAPADARPVLRVAIEETDRAFLQEGMPAKLKFAAFPYQRYGLIEGTLEYISPTASANSQNKQPTYEGRIGLQRDFFAVGSTQVPLRYGMSGTAEIVVRKRRLIDLALDPLREITAW